MTTSLGWYYREIGHRMKKNTKPGSSAKVRCSWCGCTSTMTPTERKETAHRVVRVCIDRQAMLFTNKVKGSVGWTDRKYWVDRFKS